MSDVPNASIPSSHSPNTEPQTTASETPAVSNDVAQQLQVLKDQITELNNRIDDIVLLIPDIQRYEPLQKALERQDFKTADAATTQIILETVTATRSDFSPEMLEKLPCSVLNVIDGLWRNYSDHRFGFSRQLHFYQSVGGSIETLRSQDRKVMGAFAQKVGWVVEGKVRFDEYDQWDFSLNAPEASFPAIWWKSPYGLKMVTFFFMRLLECNLNED